MTDERSISQNPSNRNTSFKSNSPDGCVSSPVPGVRGPPDGQNDDQNSSVVHHSQYSSGGLYNNTYSNQAANAPWSIPSQSPSPHPNSSQLSHMRREAIGASPTEPAAARALYSHENRVLEGADAAEAEVNVPINEEPPVVREVLGGAVDVIEVSHNNDVNDNQQQRLVDVIDHVTE